MEALYQMLLVIAGAFSCHGLYFISRFLLLPGKVKELADKSGELCNKPGHAAAVVAEKIVGLYVSTVCGLSGVAILKDTYHDVVYSKTSLILPCTCYIYWYFVHDLYAMYQTFCFSRLGATLVNFKAKLSNFLYHKRIFIFHHFILLTLAIPFAQGKIINNIGDGLMGLLYIMELSTPFISMHFIFDHTSLKDSKLQQVNGIIFIVVFFFVRILSIPFMYWLYAMQHHNGNIFAAVNKMGWYCHTAAWTMFLIQFTWFIAAFCKVLRGARRLYYSSNGMQSKAKVS